MSSLCVHKCKHGGSSKKVLLKHLRQNITRGRGSSHGHATKLRPIIMKYSLLTKNFEFDFDRGQNFMENQH